MKVLVREYKKNNDKMCVYIFSDNGKELAYVLVKVPYLGAPTVQTVDSKEIADKLTYSMGQEGYLPNGRERLIHSVLSPDLTELIPPDVLKRNISDLKDEDFTINNDNNNQTKE